MERSEIVAFTSPIVNNVKPTCNSALCQIQRRNLLWNSFCRGYFYRKDCVNEYYMVPLKELVTEPAPPLHVRIALLLEDLLYPSESDEPVEFLSLPWDGKEEISIQEFSELLDLPTAKTIVEEKPEGFWSPVTTDQEWYGNEERERTVRFVELKRVLEDNLMYIHYFEVGDVEVALYLVGQLDQRIMGIKTMAVRT